MYWLVHLLSCCITSAKTTTAERIVSYMGGERSRVIAGMMGMVR